MAAKQIRFRAEARERVLRGAATLADAVRVTLGPKSTAPKRRAVQPAAVPAKPKIDALVIFTRR